MTDIESLTPEEQYKVFWLQEHLFENGIEGIHFTEKMLEYLEGEADDDIEQAVERAMSGRRF